MGKLTKYTLEIVLASLVVWLLTVMVFTDELVFTQPEDPSPSGQVAVPIDADFQDGVFTGSAQGHNAVLVVDVTIEGGDIADVAITDHAESDGIADPAIENVPAAIVESNSTDVETVSGATVSSEAIIAAVNDALAASAGDDTAAVVTEEEEAEEEVVEEEVEEAEEETSEAAGTYNDGTYKATVDGHNGPLELEVTVEDGVISAVDVLSHEETDGISDPAFDEVPAAIVESNSTDVETVSGATVSSEAIIEAVNTALEDAQ